jgi:hypothetical protein
LHLALHALVPLGIAAAFGRRAWLRAWAIMIAAMLIDIDHLLADPIYDPMRCSIGFHPLHTAAPIALYALALIHPRTRWLGVGLLVHVALDSVDCYVKGGVWFV